MKPKLKPPETKRLKLNCDIMLSTSAFEFNLRRYTTGSLSIVDYPGLRGCDPPDFEVFSKAVPARYRPPRRLLSDKISHIDMGEDHIDTVISHIHLPYRYRIISCHFGRLPRSRPSLLELNGIA